MPNLVNICYTWKIMGEERRIINSETSSVTQWGEERRRSEWWCMDEGLREVVIKGVTYLYRRAKS